MTMVTRSGFTLLPRLLLATSRCRNHRRVLAATSYLNRAENQSQHAQDRARLDRPAQLRLTQNPPVPHGIHVNNGGMMPEWAVQTDGGN